MQASRHLASGIISIYLDAHKQSRFGLGHVRDRIVGEISYGFIFFDIFASDLTRYMARGTFP